MITLLAFVLNFCSTYAVERISPLVTFGASKALFMFSVSGSRQLLTLAMSQETNSRARTPIAISSRSIECLIAAMATSITIKCVRTL